MVERRLREAAERGEEPVLRRGEPPCLPVLPCSMLYVFGQEGISCLVHEVLQLSHHASSLPELDRWHAQGPPTHISTHSGVGSCWLMQHVRGSSTQKVM